MKFYPNVFFKIFKSNKIIIFIALNFILSLIGYIVANGFIENQINDTYVLKVTSFLGVGINYLTLGVLLWLSIMFEVIKLFRVNNDNGIMLNQITKPISRKNYYIQLIFAVYLAFVIVSIINILLSLLAAVLVFQTININMILLSLGSIVFTFIHVAYITVIITFIAIIINQTELSIFISSIVSILIFGLNLVGSFIANSHNLIYRIYATLIAHESYVYIFLLDKVFYPFTTNINQIAITSKGEINNYLYHIIGYEQFVKYDVDLEFTPRIPVLQGIVFNLLFFVITFGLIYVLAKISIKKFENSDITGN